MKGLDEYGDEVRYAKYKLVEGRITKDGHLMFLKDIVNDLNRKSYLEEYKNSILRKKTVDKNHVDEYHVGYGNGVKVERQRVVAEIAGLLRVIERDFILNAEAKPLENPHDEFGSQVLAYWNAKQTSYRAKADALRNLLRWLTEQENGTNTGNARKEER